ncbi:MAG TPA: alpha-L-arabinofuranosidase C-terminal domain-containing protein [Bryobacteraceae bacterium]|nr:alpha-L-arabinofuranosidase C-terminal domain-containing protein [Bryobacteraceae bacterium]
MKRRDFLTVIPAGLVAARSARAADGEVNVFLKDRIGTISPLQHGHFIEHLGGVIYDGVWVGEDSKIPNVGGVRKALIDAMTPLAPTVMRWPGGCFADSYDWRDGIGPRAQRPRRRNFWASNGMLRNLPDNSPAKDDPNSFGTNEFLRFTKLINAEPYLAANLRGMSARDFDEWIEYCNAPKGAGTAADRRAANGDPEPFHVRYWGVGNESWGCGGEMTSEEYSVEFRKFTAWTPTYGGPPLAFIASGPNGGDYRWSRGFFSRLVEKSPGLLNRVWGWALHYYCGTTGKGDSLDFTSDNAYELLDRANRMEGLITRHWDIMSEYDREHRVKLVVDEWGAWHHDTTAVAPHHLFGSVPTMRDALVAAISLDTFHRHADKVAMANAAQLINCIQTLFLADGDKFCVTPTYEVFAMYKDHCGADAVRSTFGASTVGYAGEHPGNVVRLAGSASRSGNTLTITAAHTHLTEPLETNIQVFDGTVKSARATVLTGPDIHAHNDFSQPHAVKTTSAPVEATGSGMRMRIPPASVVKIQAEV